MVKTSHKPTARPIRWSVKVKCSKPFHILCTRRLRKHATSCHSILPCMFRAEVCRNIYVIVDLLFHMISDTSLPSHAMLQTKTMQPLQVKGTLSLHNINSYSVFSTKQLTSTFLWFLNNKWNSNLWPQYELSNNINVYKHG